MNTCGQAHTRSQPEAPACLDQHLVPSASSRTRPVEPVTKASRRDPSEGQPDASNLRLLVLETFTCQAMHVGEVGCTAAARSHGGAPGGKALAQEGDGRLSARPGVRRGVAGRHALKPASTAAQPRIVPVNRRSHRHLLVPNGRSHCSTATAGQRTRTAQAPRQLVPTRRPWHCWHWWAGRRLAGQAGGLAGHAPRPLSGPRIIARRARRRWRWQRWWKGRLRQLGRRCSILRRGDRRRQRRQCRQRRHGVCRWRRQRGREERRMGVPAATGQGLAAAGAGMSARRRGRGRHPARGGGGGTGQLGLAHKLHRIGF